MSRKSDCEYCNGFGVFKGEDCFLCGGSGLDTLDDDKLAIRFVDYPSIMRSSEVSEKTKDAASKLKNMMRGGLKRKEP